MVGQLLENKAKDTCSKAPVILLPILNRMVFSVVCVATILLISLGYFRLNLSRTHLFFSLSHQ